MPLTRNIRQAQGLLTGSDPVTLFTGISQSRPSYCWSLSRIVVAPLGDLINIGSDGYYQWSLTVSEGPDSGSWSELDGFEHPALLARFQGWKFFSSAPFLFYGTGDFPLVYDFPKGLVTIAPEICVQQTTTAAGLEEVSFRLYYSQITIDTDDLVFLRSVR